MVTSIKIGKIWYIIELNEGNVLVTYYVIASSFMPSFRYIFDSTNEYDISVIEENCEHLARIGNGNNYIDVYFNEYDVYFVVYDYENKLLNIFKRP